MLSVRCFDIAELKIPYNKSMLRGVLLDVDGTLVLSNDAHALAWVQAFMHHGYKITFDDVRPLIGMGGDKLIPKLVPDLTADSAIGEKISSYRSKLFLSEYVPNLKPAPGSRELILKLHQEGMKLIFASSAQAHELEALLRAAQVDDLLKESTTASDTEDSKPDPDIVGVALDKLNLSAPETIMIGDTPYDIQAANQCGINVIAVRCGGWKDRELAKAIAIYDDPNDLLANYATSPLAR